MGLSDSSTIHMLHLYFCGVIGSAYACIAPGQGMDERSLPHSDSILYLYQLHLYHSNRFWSSTCTIFDCESSIWHPCCFIPSHCKGIYFIRWIEWWAETIRQRFISFISHENVFPVFLDWLYNILNDKFDLLVSYWWPWW